jgi:hypothetical protein
MKITAPHALVASLLTAVVAACSGGGSGGGETVIVVVEGNDGGNSGSGSGGGGGSGGSSSGASSSGSSGAGSSGSSSGSQSSSSSGGTTADGSTSMPPPPDAATSGVPCDVANYLAANCTGCHSDPPVTGALTGLVTYADLTKPAIEDPTKSEIQLSVARMQGNPMPYMPPGAMPAASDVTILQNWITAGLPMGSCGSSADGGSSGGGDGGTVMPPSVFDGQPPFSGHTASGGHNAGRACFSCHTSGCVGGGDCGPQLVFGGTLYDGSGNPVPGAEVRFVDGNNVGTSVYTSTNGDFWLTGNSTFAAPAHVGVRNASAVQNMFTALQSTSQPPAVTGGDCNACHCTGTGCTVAPIHLP